MRQRRWAALVVAALCLGLLTGCGEEKPPSGAEATPEVVEASTKLNKPPQSEQILSDVNRSKDIELPAGVSFTTCEVIKRQSNTENKEDIAYCALTAESSFYRSERQYRLLYNFYDEGGWILDDATPENEDEWTEAYLDAAGNDILDDMIWLDAFSPERLTYAEYIGKAGGLHYLVVDDQLYDQNGHLVTYQVFSISSKVIDLFLGKDGALRLIVGTNGKSLCLRDTDGTQLSDTYKYIIPPSKESDLCIVGRDDLYGAIDENGALVVPIQYETYDEVIPGYTTPVPEGYQSMEYPVLSDAFLNGSPANGVFNVSLFFMENGEGRERVDVINSKGESVLAVPYADAYMDHTTCLVVVYPESYQMFDGQNPFRLYDLDGNCRSPEFFHVGSSSYEPDIVNYQGRCGILPQILTDEERHYYFYFWGMEHQ